MPGMNWSTPLVTGSIGIRIGPVQVKPLADVDMTMSFDVQPVRKRQSCQTTYTVPWPSTSADGSAEVRRLPATGCSLTFATWTTSSQLMPPLTERNDWIPAPAYGTITSPFGWTTGWPPRPVGESVGWVGALQVSPPSVEVLMKIAPPIPKSSHSV